MLTRRGFVLSALATPFAIKAPGLLMPIKSFITDDVTPLPPGIYNMTVEHLYPYQKDMINFLIRVDNGKIVKHKYRIK